jgi:hypothetical protein
MIGAVAGFVDRQRATHQAFRFAELVGVFQQLSEVVEMGRDTRIVWLEVRLSDGEGPPIIRFGAMMQRLCTE